MQYVMSTIVRHDGTYRLSRQQSSHRPAVSTAPHTTRLYIAMPATVALKLCSML